MTVELNPEIERWVQVGIQCGHFHSAEEAIEQAVAALMGAKRHTEQFPERKPKKNCAQFFLDSPLPGSEVKLERQKDYPRPIDL